jgi:hypothetical protein
MLTGTCEEINTVVALKMIMSLSDAARDGLMLIQGIFCGILNDASIMWHQMVRVISK